MSGVLMSHSEKNIVYEAFAKLLVVRTILLRIILLFQCVPSKCWQRKLPSLCPWRYHGFVVVLSTKLERIYFED